MQDWLSSTNLHFSTKQPTLGHVGDISFVNLQFCMCSINTHIDPAAEKIVV